MGYGQLGFFAGFDHGQAVNGFYALKITESDVNISNYKSLETDIARFLVEIERDEENKGIILDFSDVDQIDSAGVGFLVESSDRAMKNGHFCALANVNNTVYKVLKLTAMTEEIFKDLIFKSLDEAYEALKDYVLSEKGSSSEGETGVKEK